MSGDSSKGEEETTPPSSESSSGASAGGRLSRPRLIGKRVALVLYGTAMGILVVASTVQITQQVFFPPDPASPPSFKTCEQGLMALYDAVQRGREAATASPEGDVDEEAALLRYRAAVEPVWRYRHVVARLCQRNAAQTGSLDSIERLRYSEEHGVRHQAAELTALRRRVRTLMDRRLGR